MILQILGVIAFSAMVFTGLLAHACAKAGAKPYPRNPRSKED